ncbi:unnamed protein product, partial [Amoebophrya sp. A25]|eukprot:GSA25T00003771001.1
MTAHNRRIEWQYSPTQLRLQKMQEDGYSNALPPQYREHLRGSSADSPAANGIQLASNDAWKALGNLFDRQLRSQTTAENLEDKARLPQKARLWSLVREALAYSFDKETTEERQTQRDIDTLLQQLFARAATSGPGSAPKLAKLLNEFRDKWDKHKINIWKGERRGEKQDLL